MLPLDYKDVAAKLFEQFREPIREYLDDPRSLDAQTVYDNVYLDLPDSYIYLSCFVETFQFLDEEFYQELKAQILWYIEGEIQGP